MFFFFIVLRYGYRYMKSVCLCVYRSYTGWAACRSSWVCEENDEDKTETERQRAARSSCWVHLPGQQWNLICVCQSGEITSTSTHVRIWTYTLPCEQNMQNTPHTDFHLHLNRVQTQIIFSPSFLPGTFWETAGIPDSYSNTWISLCFRISETYSFSLLHFCFSESYF